VPVTLETVELAAPSPEAVTAALEALVGFEPAVFIEGPRGSVEWVKTVAAGHEQGALRGAEIRCGGARAELVPFRAYGSCSTSEPREEAVALGLLPDSET
jgi:hypothetical protein